ncbi:MAG TPA: alpha/beta hydrolase [Bryobacteraceae bacterium]|nr:alpha/beta hydrolase [Bryobacteraceae bacterium]
MAADRFAIKSTGAVEISVLKSGSGPALLLVHGALLNVAMTWFAVLPKLAEQFTVYAMDRRGRPPSGDGKEYSIALEVDDITSVIAAIGQPVIVLAHSYGALVALAAVPRLQAVRQLILYEPPGIIPGPEQTDAVPKMERALEAGNREEIVTLFLRDQIGAPPEVLAGFKQSPLWPKVLEISPTLPRESRTVNASPLSLESLAACSIPAVILAGSETRGRMREGVDLLCRTIPDCRLVVLEGQGHTAMMQAPELFVDKVLEAAQR